MASNYKYNGLDLDSIFAPRGDSAARANTGYTIGGAQDLADRYYSSTGGDTPGYNVGYSANGTDIGSLFRSIGYSGAGTGGGGGGGGGPPSGPPGGGGGQQA